MSAAKQRECFVIGPIGGEHSPERDAADVLLEYIIKPALEANYRVTRADDISTPGIVDAQVIIAIKQADLVVADLHGENPNAYYELGIAHALTKRTIHLIAKGARLPFDLQQYRTIFYGLSNPKEHREASAELKKHAATLEDPKVTVSNPVTAALGFLRIQQTGDDRDKMIARQQADMSTLNAKLAQLEARLQASEQVRLQTPNLNFPYSGLGLSAPFPSSSDFLINPRATGLSTASLLEGLLSDKEEKK
jgi:hypothetical protein